MKKKIVTVPNFTLVKLLNIKKKNVYIYLKKKRKPPTRNGSSNNKQTCDLNNLFPRSLVFLRLTNF